MDAMACDFCSHILANLKAADQDASRQPPLIWHWNGRNWTGAHLEGVDLVGVIGLQQLRLSSSHLLNWGDGLYFSSNPDTPPPVLAAIRLTLLGFFLSHLGIIKA